MDEQKCKCDPGLPGWLATFSDLMALMLCFFVLLLSFSEVDVVKYKQIAGSMKYAFGVQNQLEAEGIPKGTSVIALDFRPGRPEPTPIDVIMQQTADITQQSLHFQEGESERAGGTQRERGRLIGGETMESATQDNGSASAEEMSQAQNQASAEVMESLEDSLKQALKHEIDQGAIDVEHLGQQLVIRLREKGAFPEGSAFLQPQFRPLIHQIAELVKDVPGMIQISGHTDNQPLDSDLYRSNWDLSSQRAVSVAQEMEKVDDFPHARLEVRGMADTQPLVPNHTAEQRARNRRVEISIIQGSPQFSDELPTAQ